MERQRGTENVSQGDPCQPLSSWPGQETNPYPPSGQSPHQATRLGAQTTIASPSPLSSSCVTCFTFAHNRGPPFTSTCAVDQVAH
ncbi:hypothetical protein E2C01_102797 [Portunus trituberculatus]|uniref:Uncharacterized protein n=1 Tax=Portunus trituberculatus TaxID=210409 RepID=A0A5B7KNM2_PORTR|nr:hypothetical protein [Portunus trituberculatus]